MGNNLVDNLIALGIDPAPASQFLAPIFPGSITLSAINTAVAQSAATGLTAAGTTITDALQLTSVGNNVTTAAASTGVKFWDCPIGAVLWCRNGGASDLKLYPPTSLIAFNGGSAGSSVTLTTAAKQIGVFSRVSATLMIGFIATAT